MGAFVVGHAARVPLLLLPVRLFRFRMLFVSASVLLAGCGEERHGPDLVPVTGTVTYNDEPVEGATIVFVPQDHTYAALAKSDAQGQFRLKTLQANPDDGAVPGKYKVTFRKFYFTPNDVEIQVLPKQYGLAETTALTATVAADQENDFTFELVD